MRSDLLKLLSRLDVTEVFKTKGDLRRWSAKRTIGGVIVLTTCSEILEVGVTWPHVVLCAVGVTPLCLSFYDNDNQRTRPKRPQHTPRTERQ